MRHTVKLFLLLAALFAAAGSAWAGDGRILGFEGDVRVNGEAVTDDTVLTQNDIVVTAEGAWVKIVLSDNSVLDVDSDSSIQLSDYSYSRSEPKNNKSEISVVEGTLRYVSGLIAKEDPENISFTAGSSTIGVRGSFTQIVVDGKSVIVEAVVGEATVVIEETQCPDQTYTVPTGQSAQTDPTNCEVALAALEPNSLYELIYALAADVLNSDELDAQLAALSKSDQLLVLAVLVNNASQLNVRNSTIERIAGVIRKANPDNSRPIIIITSFLDNNRGGANTREPVTTARPPDRRRVDTEVPPGGAIPDPPSPE